MKKIIVPTDFSPTAKKAQDFTIESAKLFDAEVTLLHSFEIEKYYASDYIDYNKDFVVQMVSDIEKHLDDNKKDIKDRENMRVQTYLSSYDLSTAIKKASDEKNADLIVMGIVGKSGIREQIWGRRTADVIGKTKIPIMVVPHNYTWKKPSKMLFLTREFEKDPKILNFIFEFAGLYMANVEVGVFTDIDNEKAEKLLENKQKISEYVDYIKKEYYEKSLSSQHLLGEDFEQTLHEYILENEVDMLVMVTYQRGFWRRLFNKSITKKMSFHTEIPLLAIPAV